MGVIRRFSSVSRMLVRNKEAAGYNASSQVHNLTSSSYCCFIGFSPDQTGLGSVLLSSHPSRVAISAIEGSSRSTS